MKEPTIAGDAVTGLPALYTQRTRGGWLGPVTYPTPVWLAPFRNCGHVGFVADEGRFATTAALRAPPSSPPSHIVAPTPIRQRAKTAARFTAIRSWSARSIAPNSVNGCLIYSTLTQSVCVYVECALAGTAA